MADLVTASQCVAAGHRLRAQWTQWVDAGIVDPYVDDDGVTLWVSDYREMLDDLAADTVLWCMEHDMELSGVMIDVRLEYV